MATFNTEVWLRRASKKLARRLSIGEEGAKDQYARDYAAIHGLDLVVRWANSKGISVHFSRINGGTYHELTKRIDISSKGEPETQLCTLLHECGHYLIYRSGGKEKFPNGYTRIDEGISSRDAVHKIDVIGEEFEAWHRGWDLSKRLDLVIDKKKYDEVKAAYLKTYFRWALKRGRVGDE